MKTYEDLTAACNAKIPRDVIETRDSGFGRKLSYLAGWYVIDRMNEVFGQGNWSYSSEVSQAFSGSVNTQKGDVFYTSYSAKVRLAVKFGDNIAAEFTDYGFGDGTDKTNPGKTHELAIKEAVTDGLKRCAKNLGNSFGLGLYDKSGEGIEEGTDNTPPQPRPVVGAGSSRVAGVPEEHNPAVSGRTRETTNKLISSTSKVIIDKKVLTQEQVIGMLREYRVDNKEDLTDTQANELLSQLQTILNK